ncbi:glycosyltransferase family 4 protein [Paenibacillus sp. MMS20-IR301]|uniref:glycosyltransferase family 4 protein n=1 Tax=Paenibacillus sp. MMS20-IR301 TaxID=2895946 RepID=UPI0028ECB96A|nr:glycosyltransferase family 4 protein [Paenibacillus sp. MMS20-IR301]WNS43468.1 glycosyltransferase family 4 protein [Paenibacillus sp. MMS20-IR301]
MRILITTDWYEPVVNGVVTSVVNLRRELLQLGHEVRVLTLSGNGVSFYKDGVTYIGSLGAGVIYPGARIRTALASKYIDELLEWKPDIIHSQCEFSTFFMARRIGKKLGIPIIHTYHTVYADYTHYFLLNEKWGRSLVAAFSRNILNKTQGVIAPTGKVADLLSGYGVTQDIKVVPTGIDLCRFGLPVQQAERASAKQKLNIPETDTVLLFVGRLAQEKNLEEIIEFLAKMNNTAVTLLIVGDGPNRASLEQLARTLKVAHKIVFAGMVPPKEVAEYYRMGDIFVSASQSETQGLTYVEALASGLPALCRKDPCLDQVIIDGVNGWQYTSFEQFHAQFTAIIQNGEDYRELSAGARAHAVSNYSSAAFAARIEETYIKTIAEMQGMPEGHYVMSPVR